MTATMKKAAKNLCEIFSFGWYMLDCPDPDRYACLPSRRLTRGQAVVGGLTGQERSHAP
jgi:hypothetical protein